MKKKSMLLALSAVFMAMTWMQGAYAHRITAVADPAKRCNNRGIDLAKCDQKRKKALQRGCITEE